MCEISFTRYNNRVNKSDIFVLEYVVKKVKELLTKALNTSEITKIINDF